MSEPEYTNPWEPLLLAASVLETSPPGQAVLFDSTGIVWWLRRTAALTAEQVARATQIGMDKNLAFLAAETNPDYMAARTTAGAILEFYGAPENLL